MLPDGPLVLHAPDESQAREAAKRLAAVGILRHRRLGRGRRHRAHGAGRRWTSSSACSPTGEIELLDVREVDERDDGFIPGSTHLPYRTARQAAENGLCGEKPIVTICESGARAAIAASVLHAAGLDARPVLDGGVTAWRARGHATTTFRRCGS